MPIELRDYQDKCISGVRQAYKDKKHSPLLVSPTGSGKTVMFGYMAQSADARGNHVMIMAHRKELLTQCGSTLMRNDVSFAYINPKFTPDYSKRVQVGTIQSIVKRMDKMLLWSEGQNKMILYVPDIIVIDEAHRAIAQTYIDIIQFYKQLNPNLKVLGVTASPVRTDGQPLSILFDCLVLGPSVSELIDLGWLIWPEPYGPRVTIDLSGVETGSNGDHKLEQLEAVMDTRQITGDAVTQYNAICPGRPTVVFCTSIKHAKHVAEAFREAGYLFEHIDGTMKDKERDGILKRLAKGEIHGITSVDLVSEGFDAPMLECGISLRPTLSLALAIQMPGRIMRTYTNEDTGYVKKNAYWIDLSGICARHGYVDDPREWDLDSGCIKDDGGLAAEKEDKAWQCPKCYRINKMVAKICKCGYVRPVQSREVYIDPNVEIVKLGEQRVNLNTGSLSEMETLEKLKDIGRAKGYADSWAMSIWRDWKASLVSSS